MKGYHLNRVVRFTFIIGLLLLVSLTGCFIVDPHGDSGHKYSASESFEFEVEVENQNSFRIHGVNGTIEIVGKSDSAVVEVWGEKTVKSETRADARSYLDNLRIQMSSSQDEVFIWTDQPRDSNGRNYEVNYQVRIPESWLVFVENTNGIVDVKMISNHVSADLTNGDLHLTDIVGQLDAGLTNGNIDLMNIFGSVDGDVTNGKIFGDVTLPIGGYCQLEITNGNIDLEIPRSTSAGFSARVTNGNIQIYELTLNNMTTTKGSAAGTLGDGNGTVILKVTNGNIDVRGF